MKYADEFRNPEVARHLIDEIHVLARASAGDPLRIMEFCGGHTHAIMRYGLRKALTPGVRMLSGPGCPVCVTDDIDIDRVIAMARLSGVTVATFGDMVRVPGTGPSLQEARAKGASVHMVYSALDAVELARKEPDRKVIMLGIGFETTAPTVAASLVQARELGLTNYYVYCLHKLTPPAMRAILDAGEIHVDAILGPGHVTTITGWQAWEFLPLEYDLPCAVSGFEPLDMLRAVHALVRADTGSERAVINTYSRNATAEGNEVAQGLMAKVYQVAPATWRGLGEIPASGLRLSEEFLAFDALEAIGLSDDAIPRGRTAQERGCRCGEVLRGVIDPPECPLFGNACTPAHPVGSCMVSAEGACAAHHRYGSTLD